MNDLLDPLLAELPVFDFTSHPVHDLLAVATQTNQVVRHIVLPYVDRFHETGAGRPSNLGTFFLFLQSCFSLQI